MKSIKSSLLKPFKSMDASAIKNISAIALIFILVAAVGAVSLKYTPDFGVQEQVAAYNEIAQNLTEGRGFVWNNGMAANETPGYPYFLAVIYSVFGYNDSAVKIIQLFLLGLIGVIVYFICKRLSVKFTLALLAGLAGALWPYFLLYSNLILPGISLSFLLIIAIYLLLSLQKTPTYLKAVGMGVVLGLSSLIRPMVLLLPFWLVIGSVIFIRKFRKPKTFLKLLVFIIAFIATLSPWTIRNYMEFHEFSVIKSEISSMTEAGVNESLQEQALAKKNPVSYLKNLYLFWNPGAEGKQAKVITNKYPKTGSLILIYKIIFFCILALALFSLKFLKQKKILLLWLCIAYFWAGYILINPIPRYTLPIIPVTIVLGFFTINHLFNLLGRTSK